MVAQVKALGAPVELITNGTLLTEHLSRQLIKAGVDVLWVSLDGATPESYADVRLGAALPEVMDNSPTSAMPVHLRTAPTGDRDRVCGDEAQHRRPAGCAATGRTAGRVALHGEQRPALHGRDA